jgi:fatty-acyl-CoA synthase
MNASWTTISDAVFHHARQRPNAPAIIDGGETLTYGQLATLVAQASVYLHELWIKPGDRVAISLTNTANHLIISLATARIGATPVELAPGLAETELKSLAAKFSLAAAFIDLGYATSQAPITISVGARWRDEITSLSGDARYGGDPEALRVILLSSGSTGIPKGIVTTPRKLLLRAASHPTVHHIAGDRKGAILLMTAPPHWSMFNVILTAQFIIGGPVVLLPKFGQKLDLVHALASWKNAVCPIVPGQARAMLSCAARPGNLFPGINAFFMSGQPLRADEKRAFLERVSPHLHEHYGTAGFGVFSFMGPAGIAAKPASVGRLLNLPGSEIEIVDEDERPVPPGTTGRIRARGPTMSLGFYNPEDNARGTERFAGGWYYPGDIVQADEDGFLTLKGRIADTIKIGHSTIYPSDIENIISQQQDVSEAVVVSRPIPGGEEIIAFIVGRAGLRHEDISRHCRANLPANQQPRTIYYLGETPRTANGKIDRPALKQIAISRAQQDNRQDRPRLVTQG